jgi:hypothetical protein
VVYHCQGKKKQIDFFLFYLFFLKKKISSLHTINRGSTKTTVAPFRIRMLQSEELLHKISLRYVEDKNREPIHPREVDFAIITDLDESEIEEKLREAQRYVQNPSIDFDTRLPPDSDELAYTKNAVCVTISGPDQIYNLSMVDLPGK